LSVSRHFADLLDSLWDFSEDVVVEKFITILFSVLYLLLTNGIQVVEHTCGGETTADVMPLAAEDPCGCGDMAEQSGCCTIRVVTIQLDDAQQGVQPPRPEPLAGIAGVLPHQTTSFLSATRRGPAVDASPPSTNSLLILHCTFLL
jgi:hypothetical protein